VSSTGRPASPRGSAGGPPGDTGGPGPLRRLAKVELHRHLDGSVRPGTIWEIAREHGIPVGFDSREDLDRGAVIREPMKDLDSVLARFATQQAVLCSREALSRITFENVEDAWRDGVRLVELRFAPAYIAEGRNLSHDEIIDGVLDGTRRAMAEWPVEVGLIGILPRSYAMESNVRATEALIRWKRSGAPGAERICGFDLADREADFDPALFAPLVEQAREAGMGITIHSGEETDARHIAAALEVYRPSRIGHGIRCWGNAEVMRLLIERDVLLEVCPTSNWITGAVPSLADHPLPGLLRAGVPVCLNSDDPNLFGIDLVNEYEVCAREYGFAAAEFSAMNDAALRHSFLPAHAKDRAAKEIASGLIPAGGLSHAKGRGAQSRLRPRSLL
jgi:adenosine deaminase